MATRKCFLRCLLDSHEPIKLPHSEVTIIGRSKVTKIKDQSCSRQQLSLKPNCEDCTVEVTHLGINPSGLNGFSMTKSGSYKIGHGSKIEVLLNNYVHLIEFDPPPISSDRKTSKRKLEDFDCSLREKKTPKLDMERPVIEITATSENTWAEIDNGELYVFTARGVKATNKIAAFDMDGTLIRTNSGKIHPVDINDWQISFPTVASKLKELLSDGFKLIILSNQAPIGSGRVKIEDFKKKIEGIVKKLDVPMQVYIATGKGIYRKPMIGMWNHLVEKKNDSVPIEIDKSFYCGDAAGRVANWAPGKKKDHSMADKLLAENLSIKFYTPEQYFLGHSVANVQMSRPEFDPKQIVPVPFNESLISEQQEILVLVGYPASGKSFLAKQIESKSSRYSTVCRDVLGTWQKCAAKANELLKLGKSVIVDSTNPDAESRARWTALAKDSRVVSRCAKMATTKAHAQHNNKFRELMKINHMPVNDIVFHTFKNKFSEPSTSEGFKQVIEVKFNPTFQDPEAEKLYKMHLLEK